MKISRNISQIDHVNSSVDAEPLFIKISRRDFSAFIPTLLVSIMLPFKGAKSEDKLKVVWSGLGFMGKCNDDCGNLDIAFPNIRKIFRDGTKISKIWKSVTQKLESTNEALPIEVIISMGETADVGQKDVGMALVITSEAEIASQYYASDDVTLLVYEIQCYGIVFDLKKFSVMNSFPIRLWRADKISGKKNNESIENLFFKSLSGLGIHDGKTLPEIFGNKLKNINFSQTDAISIRVTKVDVKKMMGNWVVEQSKTVNELKSLAGNSLTSAISETVNIGIQPFSVAEYHRELAVTMNTTGASGKIYNTLDLPVPDLDIRLALRGVKVKVKKTDRKFFSKYRITIGVEITVAKYKYETTTINGFKEVKETLIETILKQKLRAISIEESTDQWRNDWYWVLDLHHALFEWFFASIMDPTKIPEMTKGQQRKGKTRKFFFQVYSKDKNIFQKEASQLSERLLPN